ncbi:MAG: phosphatidate cytidylyltransferase [Bacteroidetes bacterium]|nr:phosphatidate cytidylyltransferase [Bacteroidota bacterium]
MNNFWKRTITGTFFIIVVIASIIYSWQSAFTLFFIISILGLLEFYKLISISTYKPLKAYGIIVAIFVWLVNTPILSYFYSDVKLDKLFAALPPLLFLSLLLELFRKKENPMGNTAVTLLGVLYIPVSFTLLFDPVFILEANATNYSYEGIIGIFIILWSNDTGAYLVGSKIGKNKLFERISPGKTWEGTIGGAVFAVLAGYIVSKFYTIHNTTDWMAIALIIAVIGTLGDLIESQLKRSVGVKDSGTILPGHGGILDRFDSFILIIPFIYFYLKVF